MTDFYTNCARFGRFCSKSFKIFFLQRTKLFFKNIYKNFKNHIDFAKKLSHKNAIKGHIFGDADFADF